MKSNYKFRVLVADDHYVVRMGLIAIINNEPDLEVVAETSNGSLAVELSATLTPDLVLLDSRMPIKDGIQAAQEIRIQSPTTHLLMLTAFDGDEDIARALKAGVEGYVLKNATGDELVPAIRAVLGGKQWIPDEIKRKLDARKTLEPLTPRELRVLHELAKGLANKQIAEVLNITEHTTKSYLKNILAKLRVADRTEAVTIAIQRGLIRL